MAATKNIPKVEIISSEMIKPSSPTPSDRRTYQMSSLDQYAIHTYIRFILFYNPPFAAHTHDLIQVLKDSLSQTLTHYYPLAGKLVEEDAQVICDDSGAEFTSAIVVGDDLRKVMENPTMDSLDKLLSKRGGAMKSEDVLLAVQITRFDGDGEGGGGVTVGVCLSHKVADAATLCSFLKCWSAAAKMFFSGESSFYELTNLGPILDAAPKLWPPIPGLSRPSWTPGDRGKIIMKMFDFSSSSITRLKSDLTGQNCKGNPTRVTSMMALIWHTIMTSSTSPAKHVLIFSANIRRKMSPPLPDSTFGNIIKPVAVSTLYNNNDDVGVGVAPPLAAVQGILGQIKEAMEKVNEEYAKKKGIPLHLPFSAVFSSDADTTAFEMNITVVSSWCGFPFYEVDMGLCRPTWMTNPFRPTLPVVMLLDGPNNGMEALVALHEETMNKFEKNSTLLSFCDHILTLG